MRSNLIKKNQLRSGFTLIELVVVIAILAVLAAMSISGFRWWNQKAAEDKTQLLFRETGRALESYYKDYGSYPESTTANETSSVILYEKLFGDNFDGSGSAHNGKPDNGATVYLESLNPERKGSALMVNLEGSKYVLIDGWDNPIYYLSGADPSVQNNPDYDLWSKGEKTGDADTGDDVKNW